MGALAEQISKDLQKLITAWEVFSVALRDEALDFIRRITTFSIFERILILLLLLDFWFDAFLGIILDLFQIRDQVLNPLLLLILNFEWEKELLLVAQEIVIGLEADILGPV